MTEVIAVYGALLSTVLGCIAIYNFVRDRRILRVEPNFSFGLENANYDFVISNISSRPFTIIDCMASSLSKTEKGKLEVAWGICPTQIDSLFDEEDKPLKLPAVLHPGEVLIVRTTSQEIVEQMKFDNRLDFGIKWARTENMVLEITHSMSKKIHETHFKLDRNELERAEDILEAGSKIVRKKKGAQASVRQA